MRSLLSPFKGYLVKFSVNAGQKDLWFSPREFHPGPLNHNLDPKKKPLPEILLFE